MSAARCDRSLVTRDRERAHKLSIAICTFTFVFAACEWIDFGTLHTFEAHDHWDVIEFLFHKDVFVIDELSAPLFPLAALVYLMTVLSTLRTKDQSILLRVDAGVPGDLVGDAELPRTLDADYPALRGDHPALD